MSDQTKSLKRPALFIITVLLFALPAHLFSQAVRKYYFTHYGTESGLISPEVNAIVQDRDGYIWTGGVDGLQRFDGTRFKSFKHQPADPGSIPPNNIVHLLPDDRNRIWLLTDNGIVGYFDTRKLRFTPTPLHPKNPDSKKAAVKRIIRDDFGNVFVLFSGIEVVTWNEGAQEFSWKYNFFEWAPDTGIADFIQQPGTQRYWISGGKGISVYNRKTGTLSYAGNNREQIPGIDLLAEIGVPFHFHFDKKGRCWFQSWQSGMPRAYYFKVDDPKPVLKDYEFGSALKTYYETYRFFEQDNGNIWITGLNLFALYQEKEDRFELVYNGYLNERSISYERLTSITEDREKNLWVSTDNNGIYRFNPAEQHFSNISHINRFTKEPGKGSVLCFQHTRSGDILVGTWSDGLYRYDRALNLVPLRINGISELTGPSVWGMHAAADSNTIWMAAQPGLYAYDQTAGTAKSYNPPQLENRTIRQVTEDRQGNLWLGMQSIGLFYWPAADKRARNTNAITRFTGVPRVMINKVITDRKGMVWVATSLHGLYAIEPVSQKILLHLNTAADPALRIPEDGISAVLEYNDTVMVFSTSRQVYLLDRYRRQLATLGTPELIKGYIAAVEKDNRGYLWVSTTSGIYRINVRTRAFVLFNRNDGIDNDHFILAASRKLPDGRMLFGSSVQFSVFNPDKLNINSTPALPRITEFKVMNKSLLVDSLQALKRVELSYTNNSIEIGFSPMVYSSAFLIFYKMEGIDKEWKIADKNNLAIYSYLPSGKYRFMMKTMDGEANMSDEVTSLNIRIIPPFWKSWWFFSGLTLLAGLLFYWFDRERVRRKEAIQKMRSTIADNLHSDVNAALNNINILSEMARLKADKDPAKSKEYIEQIHTKSHNMIIAMDDMLWSLDPGNDSMEKTTDRMREYIDALKNRHGVNIDIAVDFKVETLPLNMKLRHDAFLVFKEGLKNLVTLGAENLHVYIKSEKSDLLFITLFDSERCDMQQLNNLLHRQDLEQRLKMLGAQIEVDLHKTHSAITMRVPVN